MRHGLKALALVTLLCGPMAANATLITFDFEELALTGYGGPNGALVSNGFVLDPGGVDWYPEWTESSSDWIGHYHIIGPGHSVADNGTQFFVFDYYYDASRLNIYGESGGVFGVRQLDLAETLGWEGGYPPTCWADMDPRWLSHCDVTFVGDLADGGTISQTVRLDGIFDGGGPLDDFQTFTFDGQWNRLTAFSISAADYYLNPGLDNLILRTVPEPSTLALFGLGLLGLGLSKWRKHA